MDLKGRVLGNRYEIVEKIGNGGMATVYKAKDNVLNRFVAVKSLREEFTTDEEFIKRFAAEAQSAASLTHPNIVSIYDVGHEDDLYYIVMELIKGKTLKEIINEDGKLPWKWSLNIAIQIASALETAHKNKIIHRDIKPHNIIITEDGIAKVTDFGIARAVSNSTITAFGTTIGSVHYFSPEHARGGFTDEKSDLYSLGVVMYEMLTGTVPFDADTAVSIALKHMQEEAIEPSEINPDIPQAVNDIIMKAMKKESNLRYQTATEMLRDLNMALKRPDGDFVYVRNNDNNFETQRFTPIEEENIPNKRNDKKKKSKLKTFISNHKVLSFFIGAILLFAIAFGGSALVSNVLFPQEIQVPNLVGLTEDEAKEEAKKDKLKLEIKEEFNSEVEKGKVISQDPEYRDNYKIRQKTTINIIISKGIEEVTVPKVIGMKQEDAIKALEDLGLQVEIIEENNKKVEEGYVIEQDIKANEKINAGETIKITVSKGTEKATIPTIVGKSEEEAKTILEGANLKVTVNYEEDSSKQEGIVLKQDPASGKTVDAGSTVTLSVNKLDSKSGTVTVNVKSITGGYDSSDDDSSKKATVDIKVNGTSVYTQSGVDKNSTAISTSFSAKGNATISVNIKDDSGASYTRSKQLNMSSSTSITIE